MTLDPRIGRKTDSEHILPSRYGNGAYYDAGRPPVTTVDLGDGYYYIVQPGHGGVHPDTHAELVALVGNETPTQEIEVVPEAAEPAPETPGKRGRKSISDEL